MYFIIEHITIDWQIYIFKYVNSQNVNANKCKR